MDGGSTAKGKCGWSFEVPARTTGQWLGQPHVGGFCAPTARRSILTLIRSNNRFAGALGQQPALSGKLQLLKIHQTVRGLAGIDAFQQGAWTLVACVCEDPLA